MGNGQGSIVAGGGTMGRRRGSNKWLAREGCWSYGIEGRRGLYKG
jgi:hypothetical protein